MKFHKKVPKEIREILINQLREYEAQMNMTSEERKELHSWVSSGMSPYDNGDYIYTEIGCPMDFVTALRFVNEQIENMENLREKGQEVFWQEHYEFAYDTENDEPVIMARADSLDAVDEIF